MASRHRTYCSRRPGVRHEIRVVEGSVRLRQAMQQSHLTGVLSNRVLEASATPIVPGQRAHFTFDTPESTWRAADDDGLGRLGAAPGDYQNPGEASVPVLAGRTGYPRASALGRASMVTCWWCPIRPIALRRWRIQRCCPGTFRFLPRRVVSCGGSWRWVRHGLPSGAAH
jgi:hypothetical protein